MPDRVFVGIDVACARTKRLPVCFAAVAGGRLVPLELPAALARVIPAGPGNAEVLAVAPFRAAAEAATQAIVAAAQHLGRPVGRVAIDAPVRPPEAGTRRSERALGAVGLSTFRTPTRAAWDGIRARCAAHLSAGGGLSRLPHANMIWMLYGFELFRALRSVLEAEVIETYPFAATRVLLPACAHKSTEDGYRAQLAAVAGATGWEAETLEARLRAAVAGARHDRLDAFMAAAVASLPVGRRRAFGDAGDLDDAVWVPAGRSWLPDVAA